MKRRTSAVGKALIKSFESCSLKCYLDIVGIPTIGWGHTGPEVHLGLEWTQQQCDDQFDKDLVKYEDSVNADVHIEINQNEFDALVCWCYNVGRQAMHTSTLLKDLNHGDYHKASEDFLVWDMAGGHVVLGLLRRRHAEMELFNKAA